MTLRRQLLIVSLLLLSLPWAGCQFVREMEGALRQGQEQALLAAAGSVGRVLQDRPDLLYTALQRLNEPTASLPLYAPTSDSPIIVDGYADGWSDTPFARYTSTDSSLAVAYQAVTRGDKLFLLLQVETANRTYTNPTLARQPNGDRLMIATRRDGLVQWYRISTAAPGAVRARALSDPLQQASPRRLRGYWQEVSGGYTLELEIPLSLTGEQLGFYFLSEAEGASNWAGSAGPNGEPTWLIRTPPALADGLEAFADGIERLRIVDLQGWVLEDVLPGSDAAADANINSDTFWLVRLLYRSILGSDQPQALRPAASHVGQLGGDEVQQALQGQSGNRWYRSPTGGNRNTLSAAAPIMADGVPVGAVIMEQDSERYLSLTDNAFSRLAGYSLLAMAIAAVGLLGFASWLSWRIRRLSRAAGEVIGSDGQLSDNFPRSNARDEIGELSRRYDDLLAQLREYQQYLKSLSRTLSHELRTPIAVVQSSLENMQPANGDRVYVDRAQEGLTRLVRILTAMAEANQLEQSIHGNRRERLELTALLDEVCAAYTGVYADREITWLSPAGKAWVQGNADLLVQALDKLVANAASFAEPGSSIEVALDEERGQWQLVVINRGPTLPAGKAQIFEAMVSHRENQSSGVHLGLGLHMVRLIAEFHGGKAIATDLEDGSGVRIGMTLPKSVAAP